MVKSFKIKPENKLTDDMKKFRMYNWWNSYEYQELSDPTNYLNIVKIQDHGAIRGFLMPKIK